MESGNIIKHDVTGGGLGLGATPSVFGVAKPLAAPVTQKRGLGGTDPKTTQPGSTGTGSVKSGYVVWVWSVVGWGALLKTDGCNDQINKIFRFFMTMVFRLEFTF